MAGRELNIEPRNQRVYEVVSLTAERKGLCKSQVGGSDSVEIEDDDGSWIGDDGLHIDSIYERLGQGGVLERGIIKPVDIIPDLWS